MRAIFHRRLGSPERVLRWRVPSERQAANDDIWSIPESPGYLVADIKLKGSMDAHREACRRQHRVLGHFLAVQAWLRGLECLVIEREDLQIFLGLERFKSQRVTWLSADLKPWFPYQQRYIASNSESSLQSLFLSRVPIEEWLPDGTLTTAKRIELLSDGAPRTEVFYKKMKGYGRLDEADVVRYLAVLDSGLSLPEPLLNVPVPAP